MDIERVPPSVEVLEYHVAQHGCPQVLAPIEREAECGECIVVLCRWCNQPVLLISNGACGPPPGIYCLSLDGALL